MAVVRASIMVSRPRWPLAATCMSAAEAVPSPARPAFDIRPSKSSNELEGAAWLRAEAYYENKNVGRFKASFVKQFAGKELYSLTQRTKSGQCLTLVASSSSRGGAPAAAPASCLGTLDVRVLDYTSETTFGGGWPDGVPVPAAAASSTPSAAAAAAAYVSNVVVAPSHRGQGLGRQLVAAALLLAREQWQAAHVYCHVEVENEPALALYTGAGFRQLGEQLPPDADGLGARLLLCCTLTEG